MDSAKPEPAAPTLFIIRVTDAAHDHKLQGYSLVRQTAFFPAHAHDEPAPEVRLTLEGLQQLFEKSGEFALAAVPFVAGFDPGSASIMIGANVHGANVGPGR